MRVPRLHVIVLATMWAGALTIIAALPGAAQWPGDRGYRGGYGYGYGYRAQDRIGDIVRRVETRSDSFRNLVDRRLDQSFWNNTRREDRINEQVRVFNASLDRFRRDFERNRNQSTLRFGFQDVLTQASRVDQQIYRLRLPANVSRSWINITSDLNRIADFYGLRRVGSYWTGAYRFGPRGSYGMLPGDGLYSYRW